MIEYGRRYSNLIKPEGFLDTFDHVRSTVFEHLTTFKKWFLITYVYIILSNCKNKYQNSHWWNVSDYTLKNRFVVSSHTKTLGNVNIGNNVYTSIFLVIGIICNINSNKIFIEETCSLPQSVDDVRYFSRNIWCSRVRCFKNVNFQQWFCQ